MKKFLLILAIALQFAVAANIATGEPPWPECYPCPPPEGPPPSAQSL